MSTWEFWIAESHYWTLPFGEPKKKQKAILHSHNGIMFLSKDFRGIIDWILREGA